MWRIAKRSISERDTPAVSFRMLLQACFAGKISHDSLRLARREHEHRVSAPVWGIVASEIDIYLARQ